MQNIVANGSGMHRAVDLKPSDPIYPCDAVTEQEKPSCYLMQTSYVLQVKHWNLPVAFRICDRVEARYVGTCYRSMGRDISGAALLDPASRLAVRARRRHRASASPAPPRTRSTTATRADGRRALPLVPRGARPVGRHDQAVHALTVRANGTSVRCMRCMLATRRSRPSRAAFGVAGRAQRHAVGDDRRPRRVEGAVSYRARA